MGLLPGGARKRAQEHFKKALASIHWRLDELQSAPLLPSMKLEVEKHSRIQLLEVNNKLLEVGDRLLGCETELDHMQKRIGDLTVAVSEGIKQMERHEKRVQATVQRARKQLAEQGFESPGLEAEAAELRFVDGGGGADGPVPDVPKNVEGAEAEASSIKGVSAAHLRRVRGW